MSLLGLKKVDKRTIVTVEGEVEIDQTGGQTLKSPGGHSTDWMDGGGVVSPSALLAVPQTVLRFSLGDRFILCDLSVVWLPSGVPIAGALTICPTQVQ